MQASGTRWANLTVTLVAASIMAGIGYHHLAANSTESVTASLDSAGAGPAVGDRLGDEGPITRPTIGHQATEDTASRPTLDHQPVRQGETPPATIGHELAKPDTVGGHEPRPDSNPPADELLSSHPSGGDTSNDGTADGFAADDPLAGSLTGGLVDVVTERNVAGQGASTSVRTVPAGVMRFVYFVESDQTFDPADIELIEQQSVALQQFWFDQFGGTFFLPTGGVEVVFGDNPAAWYDEQEIGDDSRWYRLMNIQAEVQSKLGIDWADEVRLVTYPRARIDGRVGANRYSGAWMDGDDLSCISGRVSTVPYSIDFPANCLATVAHEMGHVYGLGHVGAETDCMQFGFYTYLSQADDNAVCRFSPENRRLIIDDERNIGWLDAIPGDRR